MAVPDFMLKGAFWQAGKLVDGPLGAAIGSFAVASAFFEREIFEVGEKIADSGGHI
jgi:hypothetical protein